MTDFMASFGSGGKSNDYPYHKMIKDPSTLGIKTKGSALAKNISLLRAYVDVLITGKTKAAVGGKPLGNKYFLPTGIKCQSRGREVDRHIYINNVPDGRIPLIHSKNGTSNLKGLVPGMVGGMSRIDPLGLFKALTEESDECTKIKMETIDIDNIRGYEERYVLNNEIKDISGCWFPSGYNSITGDICGGGNIADKNKKKNKSSKNKKKNKSSKNKKKKKKRRRQGFTNIGDTSGNIKRVSITYISIVLLYIFLNLMNA